MTPKLSPEELLRRLEEPEEEEEMDPEAEAILKMTPDEIEKELLAAGYTRDELDAKNEAVLGPRRAAIAKAGAAPPTAAGAAPETGGEPPKTGGEPPKTGGEPPNGGAVVPLASRRTRKGWLALFPVAAAIAGLVALEGSEGIVGSAGAPSAHRETSADPLALAEDLRGRAVEAVRAERYAEAIKLLDEAKNVDPKGDEMPRVRVVREQARRGLSGEP
jgi:hypothetical protein